MVFEPFNYLNRKEGFTKGNVSLNISGTQLKEKVIHIY